MSLQTSKFLAHQVLLDPEEMAALLGELGEFGIYRSGKVLQEGEGEISHEAFLEVYAGYIEGLKGGIAPDTPPDTFSDCFSTMPLKRAEFPGGRSLLRPTVPVIQLQPHQFAYSRVDGKFYPMARGEGAISWGIQFSYPQIVQRGGKIEKVDQTFPNTGLYRTLQRWIRHNTRATPFIAGGVRTNVPIRLGKKCFEWINGHPQLEEVQVDAS